MTPTQAITAAVESATLTTLQAAAAVPTASRRMSALVMILTSTDPALAADFRALLASGSTAANALRGAYGRFFARQIRASAGMGCFGGLCGDNADGGSGGGVTFDQVADGIRTGIGLVRDGVEVGIDIYEQVTGEDVGLPGTSTPTPATSPWGAAGSMVSSVQAAPPEWQAAWAQQEVERAAAADAGLIMPSTGLFGSMPTWLIGAGIGGTVYGVYKLFFAKKKRRGKAA